MAFSPIATNVNYTSQLMVGRGHNQSIQFQLEEKLPLCYMLKWLGSLDLYKLSSCSKWLVFVALRKLVNSLTTTCLVNNLKKA